MNESKFTEVEKIMYSDLEPFFEAVVKELGKHAKEKHLSYRQKRWGGSSAEYAILDILEDRTSDELLKNPDDALDRTAFLGWFWLHNKGLMPEYELDPTQKAWYNIATQGER